MQQDGDRQNGLRSSSSGSMQAGERSPFRTAPEQTVARFARTTDDSLHTLPHLLEWTWPWWITADELQSVQVLDFSRERMADRSNGILEFSVNHDFQDANVFHFWERYTSNASLGQHNTQPEVTQFMENVSASNYMVAWLLLQNVQQLLPRCFA
jgi:quinol monooxygenase YgiN